MRKFVATACMAACFALTAGAAQAADRVCSGKAEMPDEAGGAAVSVEFVVDGKGVVKARSASWDPATRDGGDLASLLGGKPSLSVNYDAPTEQGLGAASGLSSITMAMTNDGHLYDNAGFVFEVPDGRRWDGETLVARGEGSGGAVTMMMAIGTFEPEKQRELFADLEAFGQVRIAIMRQGRPISQATYNLAGREERARLFTEAWGKAAAAAADWKKCEKAKRS